ncbi:MAG: hypothetical protein JOZ69_23080, partial [Myxococcales bacterium]|nr:hypothetical protein [Myxococcales bacterium]
MISSLGPVPASTNNQKGACLVMKPIGCRITMLTAAMAVLPVSCSSVPARSDLGTGDSTGTLSLQLTLPGGAQFDTVAWKIAGADGSTIEQGSAGLRNSQRISFQVGGVPAAVGDSIALLTTSTDGSVTCAGSADFDLIAGTTVELVVPLQCYTARPDAGTIRVDAPTTNCATVTFVSATPTETTVGSSVSLVSTAAGPNPRDISFSWSAPSGSFDSRDSPSPNFTCTAPGVVTLTLVVTDGPAAAGGRCDPSRGTATVAITCDAPSTASALVAGGSHNCALVSNGTVACWGSAFSGQLGDGFGADSATPVTVADLPGPVAIAAGDGVGNNEYTCAALADGTVECWGTNSGEFGPVTRPIPTTSSSVPVAVAGVSNAVALAAGGF